ncbi:hypothetical protein, partial [Herbaspirillum sp. RV1423]
GPPVFDRTGQYGMPQGSSFPQSGFPQGGFQMPSFAPPSYQQATGSTLPSESGAAKTINQFQNDHDIQLISAQQMQQMAQSGYYTDKD